MEENHGRFWERSFSSGNFLTAASILFAGITLALLVIFFRRLAVLAVLFLFLALPWLLAKPVRFYLWLLITWPVLTLYVHMSGLGSFNITYERLLVPLLVGLLLVEGLALRRKLPRISVFMYGYLAAALIIRFALFYTGGKGKPEIIYLLNIVILPITMYWLTKALITSQKELKYFLYALIAISILVCLSGLYERAIDAQVSPFPIDTFSSNGQSRWLDVPGGRAAGIAANPAVYGGMMGMGILAALCCSVHTQKMSARFLYGAVTLLLLYGLFVSYTRSAWIAAMVVLFVAQFFMGKLWKSTLPVFLAGALAVAFLASSLVNSEVFRDRFLNQATINVRIDLGQVALDEFVQRPILGWGPNAYDAFIYDHVRGSAAAIGASSSHNTYFTLLVDGGLVLLLSFVVMVVSFFWKAAWIHKHSLPGSFNRSVLWVMVGTMVLYLLIGISSDLRNFIFYTVLLFVAAGIIDNLYTMTAKEIEAQPVERRLLE